MKQFSESIRKSINDKNWYGALFMALAIPDICRSVERPTIEKGTIGFWYQEWFDRYLAEKYSIGWHEKVRFYARDCWLFRCSCLHAGLDAENKERMMHFSFTSPPRDGDSVHRNYCDGRLQLQIDIFCSDMLDAVDRWLSEVGNEDGVKERLKSLLTIDFNKVGEAIVIK